MTNQTHDYEQLKTTLLSRLQSKFNWMQILVESLQNPKDS